MTADVRRQIRGVAADAALGSFVGTIEGPVVLVGHAYGGMVITNAANGNPNVKALVCVASLGARTGPPSKPRSCPACQTAAPH